MAQVKHNQPTTEKEKLTRYGGLVRAAFIAKRKALSFNGRFVLQERSDQTGLWNRAGERCERMGILPEDLVAIVFKNVKVGNMQQTIFQNNLLGPWAVRCVLQAYGVDLSEVVMDKHGNLDDESADLVRCRVEGYDGVRFDVAVDPMAPSCDPSVSTHYSRLSEQVKGLNYLMFTRTGTTNPFHPENQPLFNAHDLSLSARSILGYRLPHVRATAWVAWVEDIKPEPALWRLLQRIRDQHPGIEAFVRWAEVTRRFTVNP